MAFLFQKLRVYPHAMALADRVSLPAASFSRPNWELADQLRRARLSIALNIAESTGRNTTADQRRFLFMARGSVPECAALFDMCERRQLLLSEHSELAEQLVTISKMLDGMIKRMGGSTSIREEVVAYDLQ